MPKFETDGSIKLDINPKEFYKACNISEQVSMCDIIMDDFNLIWDDSVTEDQKPPRSLSQREFNKNLAVLEESWIAITKKDEEKIRKITKKYGG